MVPGWSTYFSGIIRGPTIPVSRAFTLTIVTAVMVVLLEYALAFGLPFRATRRYLVLPGLAFHAIIYVSLPVATFSATMILLYLAYYDPEAVDRVIARVQEIGSSGDNRREDAVRYDMWRVPIAAMALRPPFFCRTCQQRRRPLSPARLGRPNGGEMNSSVLVFRDINRNGIYDLGDRPMPNVAVELGKPQGRTSLERTNVSGFANFRMSVVQRDREIVDPGHYSFKVLPPPGWSTTTGNAVQESDYVVTPGAPGDMIALKTTHPVGLAADLTISGIAVQRSRVSLTGPDGAQRSLQAGADGHFSTKAAPRRMAG